MPEGPEVRTIVDGLSSSIKGSVLEQIVFSKNGKYREKSPDHYRQIERLLPLKIKGVKCKGKFIYFWFQSNQDGKKMDCYMGNSLGMTGIWKVTSLNKQRMIPKHTCMTLLTNKGIFDFVDQRHFGCVHFFTDDQDLKKKLSTIGPDVLNTKISESEFIDIYKTKPKKNIVVALMDQSLVSGIGNYIKSESLYRAKINPHKTINDLTDEQLKKLYRSVKNVTEGSYKYGGMSQENYVDLDGKEGKYVNHLLVYRQQKDPKGNKVIREVTKDKRSTFWVPEIQI